MLRPARASTNTVTTYEIPTPPLGSWKKASGMILERDQSFWQIASVWHIISLLGENHLLPIRPQALLCERSILREKIAGG